MPIEIAHSFWRRQISFCAGYVPLRRHLYYTSFGLYTFHFTLFPHPFFPASFPFPFSSRQSSFPIRIHFSPRLSVASPPLAPSTRSATAAPATRAITCLHLQVAPAHGCPKPRVRIRSGAFPCVDEYECAQITGPREKLTNDFFCNYQQITEKTNNQIKCRYIFFAVLHEQI